MKRVPSNSPKSGGLIRRTEIGTRVATALMGVALTVIAGYAALHRMGDGLVMLSYDIPFIVHQAGGADDIRIVYLDELESEQILDRSPQAKLLDKLGEAGARAVIYDLIFDRPSADPSIDQEFAAAIRRFRGVDADGNPIPGQPTRHVILACGRDIRAITGAGFEQLITPIPELDSAADGFGLVAFDDDNYVIRKLSEVSWNEPSLVWKTAQTLGASLDEESRMEPRWMNFIGRPPDPGDPLSEPPIRSCGIKEVIHGDMNAGFVRGKIVVVGGKPGIVGAELGKDLFSTPFHQFRIGSKLPFVSGVEVQATALANLIEKRWLTRSTSDFDHALVVISGVILGLLFSFLRPLLAIFSAGTLMILSITAGVFSMHFGNFWFPWSVLTFLQIPTALVWGIASHAYVERFFRIKLTEEKKVIRAAFAKYLSPQMLDRLTREGFKTNLGGEKVEAAMMFTDLEAFTDMCERVGDPQRIVETLNDYFERTTGSIFDDDGVIIKFIGDAIFAAWGAPLPDPDAAAKAVRSAWKLFENDKLVVDGVSLQTRIGLHFGEVVAGNVGSSKRVDYTLIGDAVNLAARLEGLNKMFGTHILMSDAVHSRLDGSFRTRCVGRFRVKGRKEPVLVYELLGPARQDHEPEWISEYHRALDALAKDKMEDAFRLFTIANKSRGADGDGPSRFFIKILNTGESIPDGIVDLKEK